MEDRLYDLEEITRKLNGLIDELYTDDYKKYFEELLKEFEEEKDEVERELDKEATEETRRLEREYWSDQF